MKKHIVIGGLLLVLALTAFIVVRVTERSPLSRRAQFSEAAAREQGQDPRLRAFAQTLGGSADVEYAPFDQLLALSSGALLGTVTSVITTFNLPPGVQYEIHRDYEDPVIFSRANIAVLKWYRNEESYPENLVTVITEGGVATSVVTPEGAQVVEDEQGPGVTQAGNPAFVGYSVGDAEFQQGDRVVVLLNMGEFRFFSGIETVPRVTGGAAGVFTVGDEGELHSTVASISQDPRVPVNLGAFEELMRTGP